MEKTLSEIVSEITKDNIRLTDKNRGKHDFIGLYSQIFEPYRNSAEKVFEIGVNRGGSVRMWEEYFNKATIYGLDVRTRKAQIPETSTRIKLCPCDQSNKEELLDFANTNGPFDIGIDDGSHIWGHQILTFETLWPYIKPGGLFVIEDVITSYAAWVNQEGQKRPNRNYDSQPPSCVQYFLQMVDHLNFNGEDYEYDENWSDYQKTIDWVAFRTNVLWVKKKA